MRRVLACAVVAGAAGLLGGADGPVSGPWAGLKTPADKTAKAKYDSAVGKARVDYEKRLAEINREYGAKAAAARRQLIDDLAGLTAAATKAGDLDRAVGLRDAGKAAAALPATAETDPDLPRTGDKSGPTAPPIPAGTWKVRYTNGATRTYRIGADGLAVWVEEGRRTTVARKNGAFGLAFWKDRFEVVHPIPSGLLIEHHVGNSWPGPDRVAQEVGYAARK